MRHRMLKFASVAIIALTSFGAAATNWATDAHVTAIDVSLMGSPAGSPAILFQIDQPVGSGCNAGSMTLFWSPVALGGTSPVDNDRQMVNSKAILSTLQLALASGNIVHLQGYNYNAGYCQVWSVQILNSY